MLEGAKHCDYVNKRRKLARLPITPNLLRLLKHELKNSGFSSSFKLLVWATCALAFAGGFRINELLCRNNTTYDPNFTLLGNDLKIVTSLAGSDAIETLQVRIKCEKKDRSGVDTIIDVYPSGGQICPLKAVKKWLCIRKQLDLNRPAFIDLDGRPLTGKGLNNILKTLLSKHNFSLYGKISSHSFRIGLGSMLGKLGFSDDDIKSAGRWSSSAYLRYL